MRTVFLMVLSALIASFGPAAGRALANGDPPWGVDLVDGIGTRASVTGNLSPRDRFGFVVEGAECQIAIPFFTSFVPYERGPFSAVENQRVLLRVNTVLRSGTFNGMRALKAGHATSVLLPSVHIDRAVPLFGNFSYLSADILEANHDFMPGFDAPVNIWSSRDMAPALEQARKLCWQKPRHVRDTASCATDLEDDAVSAALLQRRGVALMDRARECAASDPTLIAEPGAIGAAIIQSLDEAASVFGYQPQALLEIAVELILASADAGDAWSQFSLHLLYAGEMNTSHQAVLQPDWSTDHHWLRHAAAQRYPLALTKLATFMIVEGGPQDIPALETAYILLAQAPHEIDDQELRQKLRADIVEPALAELTDILGQARVRELESSRAAFDFGNLVMR